MNKPALPGVYNESPQTLDTAAYNAENMETDNPDYSHDALHALPWS